MCARDAPSAEREASLVLKHQLIGASARMALAKVLSVCCIGILGTLQTSPTRRCFEQCSSWDQSGSARQTLRSNEEHLYTTVRETETLRVCPQSCCSHGPSSFPPFAVRTFSNTADACFEPRLTLTGLQEPAFLRYDPCRTVLQEEHSICDSHQPNKRGMSSTCCLALPEQQQGHQTQMDRHFDLQQNATAADCSMADGGFTHLCAWPLLSSHKPFSCRQAGHMVTEKKAASVKTPPHEASAAG